MLVLPLIDIDEPVTIENGLSLLVATSGAGKTSLLRLISGWYEKGSRIPESFALEADFEPQKYHDEYRMNLQRMIEDKIEGKKVVAAPSEHVAPVIDIMEALKRSLAEKRKPAQAATAAGASEEAEAVAEEAPKKRARKTKVG